MKIKRIIPKIDIKGPNLVKGINYEGLRVLGNPDFFIKNYYKEGADEIIYQDCVASLYNKSYMLELINKFSSKIYIPNIVGGGIRNLKDIELILKNGADKIFLNSAAIKSPKLIDDAVKRFGSSTISISVEANKINSNNYFAFYDYGREYSKKDVIDWIKEVQSRGAGEIILTSISFEGLAEGFDYDLVDSIENIIEVPLIINGGAGSKEDVKKMLIKNHVSGVAISSIFHYEMINRNNFRFEKKKEGNYEFLKNKSYNYLSNKQLINITSLKSYLRKNHINVR